MNVWDTSCGHRPSAALLPECSGIETRACQFINLFMDAQELQSTTTASWFFENLEPGSEHELQIIQTALITSRLPVPCCLNGDTSQDYVARPWIIMHGSGAMILIKAAPGFVCTERHLAGVRADSRQSPEPVQIVCAKRIRTREKSEPFRLKRLDLPHTIGGEPGAERSGDCQICLEEGVSGWDYACVN